MSKRRIAYRACKCPTSKSRLNLEAWRTVRRLVARINPKVQEVDLDQVIVIVRDAEFGSQRLHGRDEKESCHDKRVNSFTTKSNSKQHEGKETKCLYELRAHFVTFGDVSDFDIRISNLLELC